jgi:hypothetical protein
MENTDTELFHLHYAWMPLFIFIIYFIIINYKNNQEREPREQGSSLSLLESICDAAR